MVQAWPVKNLTLTSVMGILTQSEPERDNLDLWLGFWFEYGKLERRSFWKLSSYFFPQLESLRLKPDNTEESKEPHIRI